MNVSAVHLKDGYKVGHIYQYPEDTTLVYSNLTPRGSRVEGIDGVVAFGFQYFVQEYLLTYFNREFFLKPKDTVLREYDRRMSNYLGPGAVTLDHIADLWDRKHLPIHVKAVPEGTIVPFRVPVLTIYNTDPKFFWLTNMLETLISSVLWQPITSATTALRYRRCFEEFADRTGGSREFIPWQGHDFSFRGMAGPEAAALSGAAHLLSFTGTDTIPAIDLLEKYYGANSDEEIVGGSVPATEHSVMSVGLQENEQETFKRLLTTYPTGILSVVSDTWDFWKVLTEYLPAIKDQVMAREGKLVIRPDSGDPVKIICGDEWANSPSPGVKGPEHDGAIQILWDIFGGTVNEKGFKTLDPHIGLIYGDSITPERQRAILEGLAMKGFASDNVVLGIGSYTYQYVTRDTYGMAMKATYCETESRGPQAIFKKPATDDGVKNSAKGLLSVRRDTTGKIYLLEDCDWDAEAGGILRTIYHNGNRQNIETLSTIRARLEAEIARTSI